jgi:type IV secretory pathway TrbD component
MGADPIAFYGSAFLGSFFFASKAYLAMPVALLALFIARWLTKKDPMFMRIFQRYLDEHHAYTALPRPEQWSSRAAGWGRGLPW